ncbi:MAG: phosphoribosyltransferase [Actinomycetota bacterium]|nr:phosphoribosyltransferase [Actinomycetota bacterium]
MMGPRRYADRDAAGRVLADHLSDYARRRDVVVLGLPRGGVPVAAHVAVALQAPLDVLVVRKLGLPGQPELAMGAIAGVGADVELVRNDAVLSHAQVAGDAFEAVHRREVEELLQREVAYREGRSRLALGGQVVIVVDDGLATGSTMRAAVAAVRRQRPGRLVVAVPVGADAACETLRTEVDELMCPWIPTLFVAVGQAYVDFSATSDQQVRRTMAAGIAEPGGPPRPAVPDTT